MSKDTKAIIGTILATAIALGGLLMNRIGNVETEVRAVRTELGGRIDRLENRLDGRIDQLRTEMQEFRAEVRGDIRSLETRLSAVEHRQARTEGLLEGLRDAIAAQGRREPDGDNEAT